MRRSPPGVLASRPADLDTYLMRWEWLKEHRPGAE